MRSLVSILQLQKLYRAPLEATIQVSNIDIFQGDYVNVTRSVGVGGTGAYTYTISRAPVPGFIFDTLTGTISGTTVCNGDSI
jgi:hypothetical protein